MMIQLEIIMLVTAAAAVAVAVVAVVVIEAVAAAVEEEAAINQALFLTPEAVTEIAAKLHPAKTIL
jgi:hypothetical protein